jgi:ankyrin repeat protein
MIHTCTSCRFQYVRCQLDHLARCHPWHIQDALNELPETLDGTYERTLREIDNTNWESVQRLLRCVAVACRPLRVDELADILAFDFKAGPIPKYCDDRHLDDRVKVVLSTCPTLLSTVDVNGSRVVQFSHFSVKVFLMSDRFSQKGDTISRRYHISMTPAHTLVAHACLGILLHMDKSITRDGLAKFPLAKYAAKYWFEHARFESVWRNVREGVKQLFDRKKHHLGVWLWIFDPTMRSWEQDKSAKMPLPPRGTPLHYAAFCGLHDIARDLAIEHPQDVKSRRLHSDSTPLHLASRQGHMEVGQLLIEHGANAAAWDGNGWTPLHWACYGGHVELARLLIEHGADAAARNWIGWTPLHRACDGGHVELAQLLIEHGADAIGRDRDEWTPLHRACNGGHVELARLLIEHGADAAARDEVGTTPLHWACFRGHVELARLLIEHGANMAARDGHERTPLHRACLMGFVELARLLIELGADAAARDRCGSTPLSWACSGDHVELARLLIEHGADATARDGRGRTPLHWACYGGHVELALLLIEHGADAAVRDEDESTPLDWASSQGHVQLTQFLAGQSVDGAAQGVSEIEHPNRHSGEVVHKSNY